MALSAGARLGPYEIASVLDAAGTGEAYRARDTHSDRFVTILVLPGHHDRLESETAPIAALHHSNICALYEVGHQDGLDFLVMEDAPGETLADQARDGALAPDKALPIAIEVADALEFAHRRNVTHGNLTPASVRITESGVKVLGFGLARFAPDQSPEQAESTRGGASADILAFGAMLYEILTGREPFKGGKEPPPVSRLQPLATPVLDRTVRKCLAKSPEARWQCMHDLADELRWIADTSAATVAAAAPAKRPGRERMALIAIAAAFALLAGFLALRPSSVTGGAPVRLTILPPENTTFGANAMSALSPDGTRIVFVARDSEGRRRLWLRPLDQERAQVIAGSEDAKWPFWSPDGKSIAFFTFEKLRRVDAAGGAVSDICDAQNGTSGSWGENGDILFSPGPPTGIMRVPASGGTPVSVTKTAVPLETHFAPQLLPGSNRFLYTTSGATNAVMTASLDSSDAKPVLEGMLAGRVQDDFFLFRKGFALMGQSINPESLQLKGNAVTLVEQSDPGPLSKINVSASAIAYQSGAAATMRLTWFDRGGRIQGRVGDAEMRIDGVELAPDGSKVAAVVIDNEGPHIWIYDVASQVKTRLVTRKEPQGFPVWSPDSKRVAYWITLAPGKYEMRVQTVGNADEGEVLLASATPGAPGSWSSDGRYIAYSSGKIMILAAKPGGTPGSFAVTYTTPAVQTSPRFSPDGNWIAYTSNESGHSDIYIAAFPGGASQVRVSPRGGSQPQWSNDGKELLYIAPDGRLTAVWIQQKTGAVEPGEVAPLFDIHSSESDSAGNYDVASDGQRFVVAEREIPTSITILLNWKSLLKSK
jgi:Tol biopolymer transport system component